MRAFNSEGTISAPRSTRLGLSPSRRIIAASHTASTRLCSAAAAFTRAWQAESSRKWQRKPRRYAAMASLSGRVFHTSRARAKKSAPLPRCSALPRAETRPGMGAE